MIFGKSFSDIIVQRTLANNVITDIKVPLEYAAKDKTIVRLEGDPNLDRPFSALLPILTFELGSPAIQYDSSRKISAIAKQVTINTANNNSLQVFYSPVPYDINFNLMVYVKNQEDGAKILEQILPFFGPDWTPQVELIPELNETRNIPIVIQSVQTEDLYDKGFKQRRLILYTIPFKMKAWFWGPMRDKPIIKFTTLNMRAGVFTNNQVTMNYYNANGYFQSNSSIFAYYANNQLMANGTICKASYLQISNNGLANTGSLVINTVSGSFASASKIVTSGNSIGATIPTVNGFINGVYNDQGLLLSNPAVAESIVGIPGKTASGQATTDYSNAVSYTLVNINDDYGFCTTVLGGSD